MTDGNGAPACCSENSTSGARQNDNAAAETDPCKVADSESSQYGPLTFQRFLLTLSQCREALVLEAKTDSEIQRYGTALRRWKESGYPHPGDWPDRFPRRVSAFTKAWVEKTLNANDFSFNKNASILDVRMPFGLFIGLEATDMKKINLIDFYQMGNWLGYLRLVSSGKPEQETYNYLLTAIKWLSLICSESGNIVELKTCQPAAKSLLDTVQATLNRIMQPGNDLTPYEAQAIQAGLTRLEHALLEECRELATYFVARKRNYSTEGLIEHADNEFPDTVKSRLSPQAITDIKAAGKCLAFEVGTASGMHSFRALEAVVWDYFQKRNLKTTKPGLFAYLDALSADGADSGAIQIGQQLRIRRNPLMHPTDNYTVDDAIEAFQLCTSAITALVLDMEKRGLFK